MQKARARAEYRGTATPQININDAKPHTTGATVARVSSGMRAVRAIRLPRRPSKYHGWVPRRILIAGFRRRADDFPSPFHGRELSLGLITRGGGMLRVYYLRVDIVDKCGLGLDGVVGMG